MPYLPPLPEELQQVEYVKLYFHLQVTDYFDLPQLGLLQLRRELFQALRTLEGWRTTEQTKALKRLLQPPLSDDPVLRRQTQKPAPAFILFPDPDLKGAIEPQQRIVLPALFIGRGVQNIDAFIALLQQLGQQGLYHGSGQFVLEGVESEDASGVRAMLWSEAMSASVSPPVSDLHWLLERQLSAADQFKIEVISPLRLLQKNKPLFKASFVELFPFVLRRVSSILSSHAEVEVIKNPKPLLALAQQVVVGENSMQWLDWRRLAGPGPGQDLGGLSGSLDVSGPALMELLGLLQLGSLFNAGKGATYGSGQYRLRTYC